MSTIKTYSKDLFSLELAYPLMRWWQSIHLSEQELKELEHPIKPAPTKYRAELKRCSTAEQVMLTEGFRTLWLVLINKVDSKELNIEAWATVVGVLAEVRYQTEQNFAHELGVINPDTDKPMVSELRFQQLQSSKTSEELLQRFRRLVKQLSNKANPISVADDILCWHQEQQGIFAKETEHKLAIRWARGYYEAALTKKK